MQSKGLFQKFWGAQHDTTDAPNTPNNPAPAEAPMNKSHAVEGLTGLHGDLLSYEDIYRAAGVLSPASGYSINKVVDMLESDHIRGLSKEIKRASVLMALDASGTPVEDLLKDASRREQALNSYEAGQQDKLKEFEARKAQENVQIQAEIDRLTAHYAERIKNNQELVAREKEALRNWQMVKQQESQRISEVIELCSKRPAPASEPNASAQPNQVSKASVGK